MTLQRRSNASAFIESPVKFLMSQWTLQRAHGLTTRDVFVTLKNQVVFLYELAVVMEVTVS